MSQPPRRVTANTQPPDDAPARIVKRLEPWQELLAAVVAIFIAGGTVYALAASKADVTALDQVRVGAAANLASSTAGTTAQLGALQATVQDLRTKQATLDANVAGLTSDVSRLQGSADLLYLQVLEIARTTGARRIPAPAPDPLTRPP